MLCGELRSMQQLAMRQPHERSPTRQVGEHDGDEQRADCSAEAVVADRREAVPALDGRRLREPAPDG